MSFPLLPIAVAFHNNNKLTTSCCGMVTGGDRWRSVLEKANDQKAAWHVDRVVRVVSALRKERQSVASALRAASTIRRCLELGDEWSRRQLISHPDFLSSVYFLLGLGTPSMKGEWVSDKDPQQLSTQRLFARINEHALMALTFALGTDAAFDTEVVLDEGFSSRIMASLRSDLVVVVSATCQLIRRISELDHVCSVLGFDSTLFLEILDIVERVTDVRVVPHLTCALVNMSAMPALQFMLARCHRLVLWLTDSVFSWLKARHRDTFDEDGGVLGSAVSSTSTHPFGSSDSDDLVVRCCRTLANLCVKVENRFAIREAAPNIFDAMLSCCDAAESGSSSGVPAGSTVIKMHELGDAARRVIHLLHDDPAELQAAIASELIWTASPLRQLAFHRTQDIQ